MFKKLKVTHIFKINKDELIAIDNPIAESFAL